MRIICLLFFLLLIISGIAQNLVPNPGFERNVSNKVNNWLQPCCDMYHYEKFSEKKNGIDTFSYVNGLCLTYPHASEYMVVKLRTGLIAGKKYCARMDASVDFKYLAPVQKLEWKFLRQAPIVKYKMKMYEKADVVFPLLPEQFKATFNKLEQTYTARGDEAWLVLGKFYSLKEDSLAEAVLQAEKFLIEEHKKNTARVHDSFDKQYPPMPDFGQKVSEEKRRTYESEVQKVMDAKGNILSKIEYEYKIQIDSIRKKWLNFYTIVYFDNICLSLIENNSCNCEEALGKEFVIKEDRIYFKNIYFETGSSALDHHAKETLDALQRQLLQNKKLPIKIVGHTDNTGTDEINLRLSADRARACVVYLRAKGVNKKKIGVGGGGVGPSYRRQCNGDRKRKEPEGGIYCTENVILFHPATFLQHSLSFCLWKGSCKCL